jgi:hypothetical protein
MDSFWVKMVIFGIIVVGLIVAVRVFLPADIEVKPDKTVYDVWQADEKRLRAEPEQPTKP